MTITFEKDKNIILFDFEQATSWCNPHQYIFPAECVWWQASLLGLQQGLIIHIDNLSTQAKISTSASPIIDAPTTVL